MSEDNRIETNKKDFLNFCNELIHRDGIQEFLAWLEKSDFFIAPASTKYHGSYAGGLCEHSLNVYRCLVSSLERHPEINVSDETVAISALFHDICKVNFYKLGTKNVKDKETGRCVEKSVYEIDEKFPCGEHADKSIIILQSYMKLLPDELFAIRAHMGAWDSATRGGSQFVSKIFDSNKFAVLLHLADMEATYLIEERSE